MNGGQGENLPVTLLGLDEKVGKLIGWRTQVSNPIRGGEGRNMKKNPASSAFHSSS
jgi:hypothetical protein